MITNCNHSSYITKLPLPTTLNNTRKLIESPSSFVNGLLTPTIEVNPTDGYAYIFPSNVLPIAISSGIDFEYVTRNTSFDTLHPCSKYKSPDISTMLNKFRNPMIDDTDDVYFIGLGLWSDGCDAGGASKANRLLVKLITIHLLHHNLKEEHVFPIGFGSNRENHNFVRSTILEDLHNLSCHNKLCYLTSVQKVVCVRFFLAYIIQDRVEHCDFTAFSAHGRIFSTIPGISCPFIIYSERSKPSHQIKVQKSIASCDNCAKYCEKKKHLQNDYNESSKSNLYCPYCTDWDLLSVRYLPNDDYPKDAPDYNSSKMMKAKIITFDTMMKAKIITFHTMMKACNTIHENIYMFDWSISNAKKYAQAECIKTSIVDTICNHSKNVRASKKSLVELPIPALLINILPSGMTQKVVRLDQIMVGIMHTLFLNLGKHILSMVKSALRNKKWSELYHQSNTLLSNIQSLSLNWCKCYSYGSQEIPGSLWVSDNYLGFSLVLKHIFSLLSDENDDVVKSILKKIWSYDSIVSVIMQCTKCNELQCNKADSTAKLFLSQLNTMDNHIATINNNQATSESNHRSKRMKKDVNKIESTACILNALTIIKEMRTKGLQRNYWEGGLKGEGMFRHVKPF